MRTYLLRHEKKNRKFFCHFEKKRRQYKFMQQNLQIIPKVRMHFTLKLNRLERRSSISRLKNRCIITGRGRSVYRDFRLTRMQLRHLASFGYLMGVKKSSW